MDCATVSQVKRVLLQIESDHEGQLRIEITKSEIVDQVTDFRVHSKKVNFRPQGRDEHGSDMWLIHYSVQGVNGLAYAGSDPRTVHSDWLDHEGKLTGTTVVNRVGQVALTLPMGTTELVVAPPYPTFPAHRVALPEAAKFVPQQVPANAVVVAEYSNQVGDPSVTKNLIIVPGGFRDVPQEKSLFLAAAAEILKVLRQGKDGLLAAPWDRYISIMNYFVVWQPSPESGASNAAKHVNDNLNCTSDPVTPRFLSCSHSAMQSLSAVTGSDPTTSTTIAIVNSNVYGGTANSRVGAVYLGNWEPCTQSCCIWSPFKTTKPECECQQVTLDNKTWEWKMSDGNYMLNAFFHELGHADAYLADEYETRETEKGILEFPNCAANNTVVPWASWIGDASLGVSEPVKSCRSGNYYKPTPGLCLMATGKTDEYCAACATQITRAIYRDTTSFTGERCPRASETMVITDRDEVHYLAVSSHFLHGGFSATREPNTLLPYSHVLRGYFRADKKGRVPLRQDKGRVAHEWPSSPQAEVQPFMRINGKDFGIGTHVINFTVTDHTSFVKFDSLPASDILRKGQKRVHSFKIKVVSENDPTYGTCTLKFLAGVTEPDSRLNKCSIADYLGTRYYCGICDPGKTCNSTYPRSKFEARAAGVLSGIEAAAFRVPAVIILSILIGFPVALVGFLICIAPIQLPILGDWHRTNPMVYSISFYGHFVVMAFAITIFSVMFPLYCTLGAFGKFAAIAAIVFGEGIFVTALSGFALERECASLRSSALRDRFFSRPLFGTALLTKFLLFLCLLSTGVAMFVLFNEVDSQLLRQRMEVGWVESLKKSPSHHSWLCSFQSTFRCSGFSIPCHRTFHAQCPRQCEITNTNAHSCLSVFTAVIKSNFVGLGVMLTILSFVTLSFTPLDIWVWRARRKRKVKSTIRAHRTRSRSRLAVVPRDGRQPTADSGRNDGGATNPLSSRLPLPGRPDSSPAHETHPTSPVGLKVPPLFSDLQTIE